MRDTIFENFLRAQHEQALALAAASDILSVIPESGVPPRRYVASFACRGLIRTNGGEVLEASRFDVGIALPDDYLRSPDLRQIVTILHPWSIFHPNAMGPFLCLGSLNRGTSLVDILFQIYEIITYQRWSAHDGLNPVACEWARNNQHRFHFPLDRRPLKWKEAKP